MKDHSTDLGDGGVREMKCLVLLLAIAFLHLGGCTSEDGAEARDPEKEFQDDPLSIAIDAERYVVLIERADEGVNASGKTDYDSDRSQILRTDQALKEGALRLLLLRNRLVALGFEDARDASETEWPAWIFELPSSELSPSTLVERTEWLAGASGSVTQIGCELGLEATKDRLFCSVE